MHGNTVLLIVALLLLSASAFAQQTLPTLISLQGKLTNSTTGTTIVTADLRVNISDSAGNTAWNETFLGGVSNGFFDLLLGSTADNPLNLTFNENYNISIYVGSSGTQIGGTYLFKSGVGGISPSNITAGNFSALGNFSFGSSLFIDKTNSRVGLGTTSPATALDVAGTVTATSFSGDGSALSGISSVTPPWNSSGSKVYLNDTTAKVGIGTSGTSSARLNVSGNISVAAATKAEENTTGIIFPDGSFQFQVGANLRNITVFTSNGTWRKPTGMANGGYVVVWVVGGGGGGAGTPATANIGGSGGGGGGTAIELLTAATIGASQTVTIGAGGAGGVGDASGTGGGTTSLGALLSATGGAGGTSDGLSRTPGVGGVGSGGNINIAGQGGNGYYNVAAGLQGGSGGSSQLGGGGAGIYNDNGVAGGNYGGGGGGGATTTAASKNGGNGAAGVVIVWEYY